MSILKIFNKKKDSTSPYLKMANPIVTDGDISTYKSLTRGSKFSDKEIRVKLQKALDREFSKEKKFSESSYI